MCFLKSLLAACLVVTPFLTLPANAKAPALSIPDFRVGPDGRVYLDELTVGAGFFNADWQHAGQVLLKADAGFPRHDAATGEWTLHGVLPVKGVEGPVRLVEQITPVDPTSFQATFDMTHSSGAPFQEVSVQVALPVALVAGRIVRVDGKPYTLPAAHGQANLFTIPSGTHTLTLPSATGTVTIAGEFSILAMDHRQWKDARYVVRLRFSPQGKLLTKAGIGLTVRYSPYLSVPVSLRDVANRGFRDDVAGDGKGGWTDQGPDNDLSPMTTGRLVASGVAFDIIDPATNGGRAALVFGKSDQPGYATSASLSVADGPTWRNLYLLHASAWSPPGGTVIGTLLIRYADGTETRLPVASGHDVGNWWSPDSTDNAALGWAATNKSKRVGLFVSRFAVEAKPVSEIRIEGNGASMWMVAGVSGSPDDIPLFAAKIPLTAVANEDWAPFEHALSVEPGSVLDFSSMADAPAGKHGALVATPAGHFEFAGRPGVPARFWGVNLCYSANFLEKAGADQLADNLARSGYNVVRFHHFDNALVQPGGPSHVLNPAKLDQLDYLFAALKKRGIYINIDLFTSRRFTDAELVSFGLDAKVPGNRLQEPYKIVVAISEAAFESWALFAKNLLTHRNPYTGLTWAEDPALMTICPINEVGIFRILPYNTGVRERFEAAFDAWSRLPENETVLPAGATKEKRDEVFTQWIHDTEIRMDARLRGYLHSLGVKALLTGANCLNTQGLAFVRERYDYVDNHDYWDHPRFPKTRWRLPFAFHQVSGTTDAARVPRMLMPTRIAGKPFSVTEFNFVRPNQYRAEGGVLMPAYASLQDWDAIYNFEYSMSRTDAVNGGSAGTFSIANDPIGVLADRVSAVVFRRGDIKAASGSIVYAVQPAEAYSERAKPFPEDFSKLGLVTRIGSRPGTPAALLASGKASAVVAGIGEPGRQSYIAGPTLAADLQRDGILPKGAVDAAGTRFTSETGQIELRTDEGTVRVVTPRSELFVLPAGRELKGDRVAVNNGKVFGTVSVVSCDGEPIARSRRLLVTHLTDALSTGMRFEHEDRTMLEDWGKLPHLVRRGSATIDLRLAEGEWHAWAVTASGKRSREIPLKHDAVTGSWILEVSTVTDAGVQLAYELIR